MRARIAATLCLLLVLAPRDATRADPRPALAGAVMLPNGLALPYPTLRVFRAFGRCLRAGKRPAHWQGERWRSHEHEGIDLGGVGPDGGLGSAVRSITRAEVIEIAHGDDLPAKFGVIDRRDGETVRDGESFPRAFELAGYGRVHFFTRAKGWYRTGNMVVTVGVGGALAGHRVRYMHLGAARPDLRVGDVLEAGEELGVVGATAVQSSLPHVHIDIHDPDGESVDVAPLIGLVTSAWCGVPRKRALADRRAFKAAALQDPAWRPERWAPPVGQPGLASAGRRLPSVDLLRTPAPLMEAGLVEGGARFWHEVMVPPPCRAYTVEEDFSSGAYAGHAWRMRVLRGQVFDVTVATREREGGAPRFAIVDQGAGLVSFPHTGGGGGAGAIEVTSPFEDARRVRIEAKATSDVLITVLAQAEPYRITLDERCKASR